MNPLRSFPFVQQHEAMDCGPACLSMIAQHYKRKFPLEYLRQIAHIDREGVSLAGISEAAEKIGFRTMPVKLPFSQGIEKPGFVSTLTCYSALGATAFRGGL